MTKVQEELDYLTQYMENSDKILAQRKHYSLAPSFALDGEKVAYRRMRRQAKEPKSEPYVFRSTRKVKTI